MGKKRPQKRKDILNVVLLGVREWSMSTAVTAVAAATAPAINENVPTHNNWEEENKMRIKESLQKQ